MKKGDVAPVECPCCKKELFRKVLVSVNPDVWGRTVNSPAIKDDAKGDFMTCPHCKRRIAFFRDSGPVGVAFRLSPDQDCG